MTSKLKKKDLVESFSGIRGIYGQSINEEFARNYAQCYYELFKNKISSLVVGGDSRTSTPILKKAMINTFKECGLRKIIDVGIVPIQVCEYAILKFKASGGAYISASHNEPEYNGWKFLKEDGALLYPEQTRKLIKLAHGVQENEPRYKKAKTEVINKHKEAVNNYIVFILKKIGKKGLDKIKKAKFKILVDPNGGSGIVVFEKLFQRLGIQAKVINNKLGKFVRLIEPNVQSLAYLGGQIDSGKFEFGCGFDNDADRVEFVIPSDSGFAKKMDSVVSGQYVLALACDTLLRGTKNQVVVVNDCTSNLLRDVIKRYGAKIKEVEVGEMNVVQRMEKEKSIIGGEGSNGGVIIPPIKCRDGIMTTALILKILAERNRSLAEILETYPKYYSARTKIKCSPAKAVEVKKKLEKYFKDKGYKIKKTGGITGGLKALVNKNSFIWFRQSKTEPAAFRIITDGDNYKKVKDILKQGIKLFNKFKR